MTGPKQLVPLDQAIQDEGRRSLTQSKERQRLMHEILGATWGPLGKLKLSKQGAFALAQFCHAMDADPLTHVDILGGRPYLNSQYYEDLMTAHPHHIGYKFDNITGKPSERERWGAPENAVAVYVASITRWQKMVPVERIRSGELNPEPYLGLTVTTAEANWVVGGKNDPVGAAEPHKTARSRALRRCARKTYSTMQEKLEKIRKHAERIIEAEWEIEADYEVEDQQPAPAAVQVGAGEPEAEVY